VIVQRKDASTCYNADMSLWYSVHVTGRPCEDLPAVLDTPAPAAAAHL